MCSKGDTMSFSKVCAYMLLTIALGAQLMADTTSQIVNLQDVSKELFQEFLDGKNDQVIMELREGTSLPLKLHVEGDFISLAGNEEPLELCIKRTCYIRCTGPGSFIFSLDGGKWHPFSDFFTGMITMALHTEEESPTASLELILNQR